MGLEQIVNVNISRQTATISQAGFGTPLILGPNKSAAGVGSYSSLTDVLAEPGITTGTDEYKAALAAFSQSPKPTTVKIGKSLSKVAQVDTITPTAVNTTHYIVTITPDHAVAQVFDYTSDGSTTVSEIVAGLIALINASATYPAGVTATGTTTLILTANVAGQPFSTAVNTNQVLVHTTANVGVVESLANLSLNYDDDWYGLITTFRTDADIMQQAAYIEGVFKIFGVSNAASANYDIASTTDIPYRLKAAAYFRTWFEHSGDTANFPEAGLFGRCLPLTPGSETWAMKTIAGQTVDRLTGTQITALKSKNANYYVPVGGINITLDGKVAGGEYIDVIRLIDLLRARMQEEIFGSITQGDKLPFTNGGISVIESDVAGVLKSNQKTGGIAPDEVDANGNIVRGYSTSFPKVSDISANDRAARLLTGGTWLARIAGAIQAALINGTVTV